MRKNKHSVWMKRFLTLSLALGLTGELAAEPAGATVRHGSVIMSAGAHTQVHQLTDRAIVDWTRFSIAPDESVRFLQPGEMSVILNRVTGPDPSTILGSLQANGQVFLINPNGILFGQNSTVNVGGLAASSLSLTDTDFLNQNYRFTASADALGAVVNQGTITINDGGYAVLTGPLVANEGYIVARSGSIVLAAGQQSTLNLDGRDLIHFSIDGNAPEGTVLLAPGMLTDTVSSVLGIDRSARADGLTRLPDGTVRLVSSNTKLIQAGTLSADSVRLLPDPEINAQTAPNPPGSVVVEVVLEPEPVVIPEEPELTPDTREEFERGSEFAQDDTDLVEDFLEEQKRGLEERDDPAEPIPGWYNDDRFLKEKFR